MSAADRASRVAEIVETALDLGAEDCRSYLDDACRDDAALRAEVESLLGFQNKARSFIEAPAYQQSAERLADADAGELKPDQILGDHKIVSLLGEGGMGEVYLAEDTALGRKVAIKLLKPGLGTANFVRHFQREERILAGLDHPNIARLYGGAITAAGVPYFVMEYVEGPRLDHFCREKHLSLRDRLELFRKVCAAVTHAHQHLIIHRDIKPANIRVTPTGEPKLLDFGIAKLVDPATSELGQQTMTLRGVMTPEYASPEQIRGDSMTTASDIYSLAVILYELLTGQRPYRITSRRPNEIARAITEQEPTRPSTAIARSDLADAQREIQNPKLVRGDLDNIILKALAKEPARRYPSVAQFSEDIRRHLHGLPVIARKDTVAYRASKFIARNKIAVGAGTLVVMAIIGGLIAALWQAQNARSQRDLAQREKVKAERINVFLQDMLGAAAPEAKGIEVKVSDILADASKRAKTELADQPDVMADVLTTLGRTNLSLGLYIPAEPDLRMAVDASLKANGELHPTTATSMGWLGLALGYQGRFAEGEQISRRAIALHRSLHPKGHENLGIALYSLGFNLVRKGDGKAAEPPLREAVELIKKHLGEKHGYYLATLGALGTALERSGDLDGAESVYRQALGVGKEVEYRYRIFLGQISAYFGGLLTKKGNYPEAETVLGESEKIYREQLGDSNSSIGIVKRDLGWLYFLQGNYPKAENEYAAAVELLRKYHPREHSLPLGASAALGLTLTRVGKPAEGEPYLREVLEIRRRVLPKGDAAIHNTESILGECLTAQKQFAEAEPLLISGYEGLKAKAGDQDFRTGEARKRLFRLYETLGRNDEAARYR